MAERRGAGSTRPGAASPAIRRRRTTDAFGVFAEQFARFMVRPVPDVDDPLRDRVVRLEPLAPEDLHFDPYPFILLTLILCLQASYAAPLILLAQNRQEDRDKVIAEQDRQVNARATPTWIPGPRGRLAADGVGEVATRDFLRSELRSLRDDLVEHENDEAPPCLSGPQLP